MLLFFLICHSMEQRTLKNCKQLFEYLIYTYLETSGGQSSNLYINVVHFSTPVLIRHLWQLKTAVFLHLCLIHTVLLLKLYNHGNILVQYNVCSINSKF